MLPDIVDLNIIGSRSLQFFDYLQSPGNSAKTIKMQGWLIL